MKVALSPPSMGFTLPLLRSSYRLLSISRVYQGAHWTSGFACQLELGLQIGVKMRFHNLQGTEMAGVT